MLSQRRTPSGLGSTQGWGTRSDRVGFASPLESRQAVQPSPEDGQRRGRCHGTSTVAFVRKPDLRLDPARNIQVREGIVHAGTQERQRRWQHGPALQQVLELRLGGRATDQVSQGSGRKQRKVKAAAQAGDKARLVMRRTRREILELGQPNAGLQRLDIVCHNPPSSFGERPACPQRRNACDLSTDTN